jgi:hypothetical protein
LLSSMVSSLSNFFGGKTVLSEKENLQIIGLVESLEATDVEVIATNYQRIKVQAGSKASTMFKILNKTMANWPEDSIIENDCKDIVQTDKKFRFNMKSRQYAYLTINFKIPEMCDEQSLKITFFFTSQRKGNVFG